MGRERCVVGVLGVAAWMVGCSAPAPPPWSVTALALRQTEAVQEQALSCFDFSWVLSGDRRAAPLQVFDDGRRMWLQFSPGQGLPQLVGHTPQGWVALDYAVQGAYVVLDAVWPQVQVRAGGLEALVERQNEAQREAQRARAQQQESERQAPAPSTCATANM